MTSLHPSSTDPALPGPPSDGADSSTAAGAPPVATGTAVTAVLSRPADSVLPVDPAAQADRADRAAPGAPICSIAAAADGGPTGVLGAPARQDTVPQPRTPEDVEAQLRQAPADGGATADGSATADRLRAAFAERLRAARAEGRSLAELAAACRRSVEEVRTLLGEAGEEDGDGAAGALFDGTAPGFVRAQQAAAPSEGNRPAPVPRSARESYREVSSEPSRKPSRASQRELVREPVREEVRGLSSRRPSPSRRLRRMHPRTDRTGQGATARETAAADPTGVEPRGAGRSGEPTGATRGAADRTPPTAGADTWAVVGGGAEEPWAVPPLGILIGGSPVQPEAVGRPEERTPVRVAAEPVRVGRGTSLVVLPSWRPAIAVSVSTEQLVEETGLAVEQLTGARLTVRMNPWALHDRELDLHGWEPGPTGPTGLHRRPRRGGRG
ncbi:hypothetical protein ACFV1W_31790 [Kitasatospora sp. NPDC059648]|uniref:hypothetical protein n=1 Tax=Kitasatospora sp. NPDC059648 TaxID=3346894 RepID=UPI00369B90C8